MRSHSQVQYSTSSANLDKKSEIISIEADDDPFADIDLSPAMAEDTDEEILAALDAIR